MLTSLKITLTLLFITCFYLHYCFVQYYCSDLALEAQQRVDWHQKADSNYLDHKTINYTTN